jgi:hypothetical protein
MRQCGIDGLALVEPREILAQLGACRGGEGERQSRERGEDG